MSPLRRHPVKRNWNERGQVSVEIVLMLVVTIGICLAVSTAARQNQWFANLVSGPWNDLASIIQNGVPASPGKTAAQMASEHPNSFSRVNSPQSINGGNALQ